VAIACENVLVDNPFDLYTLRAGEVAERRRAASLGVPDVELLDLGVSIELVAPLPHVLISGGQIALVFHSGLDDTAWDGRHTTVVDQRQRPPIGWFL
jgi:hypothetical protein